MVEKRVTENGKNLMQRECVAPPIEQETMKKRGGILTVDDGRIQHPAPPNAAWKVP
jgi:hypothetical protein